LFSASIILKQIRPTSFVCLAQFAETVCELNIVYKYIKKMRAPFFVETSHFNQLMWTYLNFITWSDG